MRMVEPMDNDDARNLDQRLTVLETRFDTILPTLATKSDLLELRIWAEEKFAGVNDKFAAMNDKFAQLTGKFSDLGGSVQAEFRAMYRLVVATVVGLSLGLAGMSLTLYQSQQAQARQLELIMLRLATLQAQQGPTPAR